MARPELRPTPYGMYDYYLGGTEHTDADRAAAQKMIDAVPFLRDAAWANRGFLQRAARFMAAERGIRQFIDVGAGLPTHGNTHSVVQQIDDGCRIVYVDSDPDVVQRGNDLVADLPGVAFSRHSLQDAGAIVSDPAVRDLIDFTEPVGLILVGVVYFVPDEANPWALVHHLVDTVASGSCLALSQLTRDRQADQLVDRGLRTMPSNINIAFRDRPATERFFDGLQLVPPYDGSEPKVVHIGLWGAEDPDLADDDGSRWLYAGVGSKP